MFEIIRNGEVFIVYSIKKRLFKTYFLVFKDDKWDWILSDKTIPLKK